MKAAAARVRRRAEAGVVLLIAIFVLMLVSVVAIALIVASGTESALAANYRSSATVYYAAMAGLEEARGRMQPSSPNYFNSTQPGFIPTAGTLLNLGSVRYVINPAAGEAVNPQDPANPYFDGEYQAEFNTSITAAPDVRQIASISGTNAAGIPGPVFKWVRINAVTEQSLKIDVDGNGTLGTVPLYYDPMRRDAYGAPRPSLVTANSTPTTVQAFGVTALAVLPNGSQKVLQYVVAPVGLNLKFPAALTLVGSGAHFIAENSLFFQIDGNDQFPVGSCTSNAPPVAGIGYTNSADQTPLTMAVSQYYPSNYRGLGTTTPNLMLVSGNPPPTPGLSPDLQTPAGLTNLMQTIRGQADFFSLPASMSPDSPKTVFIDGDLDLTGWSGTPCPSGTGVCGYGILAVTGNLNYDGNVSWKGIVLVIGKGTITSTNSRSGEIDGALLVAQTTGPGPLSVDFSLAGNGVFYSHCWIQRVLPASGLKVLSFREIPQ